jgi:predicted metal-dependent HD superfamily phosphohydrolase
VPLVDGDATRYLQARGKELLARVGAGRQAQAENLVRELLDAYGEARRGYHDLRHLTEVLDHVDALAAEAQQPDAVRLAAWFHDSVHTASTSPGADEEASARMAQARLGALGVDTRLVGDVARLVRLTATHDPTDGDLDGAVLCDADLAVLARDDEGYAQYVAGIRQEYGHVPDAAFRAGRAGVLQALAGRALLFRTESGRTRWEAAARRNLAAELAELAELTPRRQPADGRS